jgi:hypothetical protein
VEAHIITNKEKIQTHHFNSQDHGNNVLGQKNHSACGIIALRLNNQRRCLLRHINKLRRVIQNKRRGMLSRGVVTLPDNARPHTAVATQDLIATFGWEQFDHPPYSPDFAPSDLHVFPHLNTFLGGRRVHDKEVKEAVNAWFASQMVSLYDARIQKLVPRYKCLNNGGNYVAK